MLLMKKFPEKSRWDVYCHPWVCSRRTTGPKRGRDHVPLQRVLGEGVREPLRPLRQEDLRHVQGRAL